MHPDLILQTKTIEEERFTQQLAERRVDSGQYYGPLAASRWKAWSAHHPQKNVQSMPLDPESGIDPLCVVDLGPGTGKPLVAAIKEFGDRVSRIICVDTQEAMAHMAADEIRAQTSIDVECIIADFLRDAPELARYLGALPERKVILCLGNTAANFRQQYAFAQLRSLTGDADRLLLGLGLYEGDGNAEIGRFARLLHSAENLTFALNFLETCGVTPDYEQVSYQYGDDEEESGVKVVRFTYRFPVDTVLTTGPGQVAFREGEELQFIESRRYRKDAVPALLEKHGLTLVCYGDFGKHGLFLCKKSSGAAAET